MMYIQCLVVWIIVTMSCIVSFIIMSIRTKNIFDFVYCFMIFVSMCHYIFIPSVGLSAVLLLPNSD
jgi:hypothetical protein